MTALTPRGAERGKPVEIIATGTSLSPQPRLILPFPAEVTLIPGFLLLKNLDLLNTFWALVLPSAANGYAIFLLKGFFDSLPRELYESAMIDGARLPPRIEGRSSSMEGGEMGVRCAGGGVSVDAKSNGWGLRTIHAVGHQRRR